MAAMATTPAQRAAWDAYVALTAGLLPALYTEDDDGWAQANVRLGGVVVRVRRYAPMWHLDGPMLTAACGSAIRLYGHGDRRGLTALVHAMAHRLFLLSAGLDRRQNPARINPKAAWNKRFESGTYLPGIPPRRNMREHGPQGRDSEQQHHEKGTDDD